MRLKKPQSLLCFYALVQVSLAHPKDDHFKSAQRNNPKKYYPTTSTKPLLNSASVKLRHSSSRFPHFDKLKTRMANLDSASSFFGSKSSVNTNYKSDNRWDYYSDTGTRMRHHGWSNRGRTTTTTTTTTTMPSPDEDLFNNYGDFDGGDQVEDDDPDNIFLDYDFEEDFQAEEATTERTTPAPRRYSSFGEYKWNQFGTRERVVQARRDYMQQKGNVASKKSSEESKTTAVVDHFVRIKSSGQCKRPVPKVIPVHIEHPDPTVTYIPHCTVLHRCAEDTGCCNYDTTCQYKERVEVSLYFYVKPIGSDVPKVEKLNFYNHTECECKEKTLGNNKEEISSTTEKQKGVATNSVYTPNFKSFPGKSFQSVLKGKTEIPESLLQKCKCPTEFHPRIKYETRCFCDCDNNNEDCVRMKKGKEYSSLVDRICIQNRECGTVSCEYGAYNKVKGRCPRYDES
ncbi:uncharacterized protein [Euwallacea fornicatus]|uniref:uncharacterized protein n=1 Tax=Euwallacea fornicatus TaxID=995702 RepID=UPI00338E8B8F